MTVDRGYVVRDARPDDSDAIRDLTLDAYAEYGNIMEPESWAGLSAAVRAALASSDPMERIVADDHGTLIGSVLLYPASARAYGDLAVEASSPELRLLAVAREARGRMLLPRRVNAEAHPIHQHGTLNRLRCLTISILSA